MINKAVPFRMTTTDTDKNGRYIIVTRTLYGTSVILANIYAPNYDDESFIKSVLNSLPDIHTHNLILAGDFTFVMDPVMDRSSKEYQPLSRSAKVMHNFL